MHTGMVVNTVQAKEYTKPPGTVMKDPNDVEWIVTSSSLSDYRHCDMELLRETFEGEQFTTVQQRISFPAIGWNVVYLPNAPPKPTLTYIDQLIRPSLRMRVQSQWDGVSIVMDTHNLNASK